MQPEDFRQILFNNLAEQIAKDKINYAKQAKTKAENNPKGW